MEHRINFFATRSDIVQLFNSIIDELSFEAEIINMDNTVFESVMDIPDLGKLDKSHMEKYFLFMKKGEARVLHKIPDGIRVYPGENPRSLECDPSGMSSDGSCLIHGVLSVMEDNEISSELMKTAKRVIRKSFENVNGWYIGPDAMKLKGKVRFVCIGVNEPVEYDLQMPGQKS